MLSRVPQHQGLFCFSHHPNREEAEGAQGVWRGQLIPADQKDIPQLTSSCLVYEVGEEEEGRGGSLE